MTSHWTSAKAWQGLPVPARSDGEDVDLRTVVDSDCELNILTFEAREEGLLHSVTPHAMSWRRLSKRLYPDDKAGHRTFYRRRFLLRCRLRNSSYQRRSGEDRGRDEEDHQRSAAARALSPCPARKLFAFMKEKEEPYKVELIEDLPEDAEHQLLSAGRVCRPLRRPAPDEHQGRR